MKLKTLLKPLACIVGSLALLYGGRVGGYYLLSVIFEKLNLTGATYADAPVWMRFLADNTDKLVNTAALATVLCFLLYMETLYRRKKPHLMFSHLFLGLMGGAVGAMLVRLLINLDCVREGAGNSVNALDYLLDVLLICVNGLLLRGCVVQAFSEKAGIAISAVLQAGAFVLAAWELDCILIINGLILGGAFGLIFKRSGSLYPELLLCGGFRIVTRRIMGFPNMKAYTVSERLLTGGDIGLEAGLLLTLVLLLCGGVFVLLIKRAKNVRTQSSRRK